MPTLHWLNDDEACRAARDVTYRLLQEDPSLSYGDPQAQNLLVQGDSLAALKSIFYSLAHFRTSRILGSSSYTFSTTKKIPHWRIF
jgi:hypothetical protein